MEPNFSGYVTKANLKCADGRTIMPGAFKHQNGLKVPLVYQHNHDDVNQVLGHVILTDKEDGVWGDAYLNNSPSATNAKLLVEHGDIDKFSIWAKNLIERGSLVHSGDIQEVSLVLAGANPGANIHNVLLHSILAHSGLDEEDVLHWTVDFGLQHADTATEEKKESSESDSSEKTVGDVLATLNEEQQTAVNAFIDGFIEEAVTEALTEKQDAEHSNIDSEKGSESMSRNVFDQTDESTSPKAELKHDDVAAVLNQAKTTNQSSLRDFIRSASGQELMHADTYGVQNIEILFPDAQALMRTPQFVDRRQEWVKKFLGGTSHSPFSRVKTSHADITADEARAKGYIKANMKTEEVFPVFKRSTGPAWVIKKQKMDREDIISVKDFDVVAWMKIEMRGKLDEEVARAGLFGDGRAVDDPDKIKEPTGPSGDGIRAIVNDHDLYVRHVSVAIDPATATGTAWNALLDSVTTEREFYMGSGNLTAFVSYRTAAKLLTIRDEFGHRIYKNLSDVAGDMDVNEIVRVPTELMPAGVLAVVVDLSDYNFGTDRGGEITLFDDFDIDFNQYKYLIETFLSGALTLVHSAQIYHAAGPAPAPDTTPAVEPVPVVTP